MAAANQRFDVSYLDLRKSIGLIGIAMPWVARVFAKFHGDAPMLMSISAYYHTDARGIFVGALFAAGLFLLFYRGEPDNLQDRILAIPWGLSAAFIGLVPMNPCGDEELAKMKDSPCVPPGHEHLHAIPVVVFFAITIYMTLFRFPKTTEAITPAKRHRNKVYKICAYIMLACVAAIGYNAITDNQSGIGIFFFEAIAIAAFSVSWLVKGRAMVAVKLTGGGS
jgi:hypothetical protein